VPQQDRDHAEGECSDLSPHANRDSDATPESRASPTVKAPIRSNTGLHLQVARHLRSVWIAHAVTAGTSGRGSPHLQRPDPR